MYGQFYVGITERFKKFGDLPGATLERPDGASYKIPVVNGATIFPWRFSRKPADDVQTTVFGTSNARISATKLEATPAQGTLNLGVPDPGLSDEEREFLDAWQATADDPDVNNARMVLVAINSSVHGLHSLEWGQVRPTEDGRLEWDQFYESLLHEPRKRPVSTSPNITFSDGGIPPRLPEQPGDAVNTQRDE